MTEQWGRFDFILSQTMRKRGFDRDRLAYMANVQKSQLDLYIDNKVKRPDLSVLARICAVMNCNIGDILTYLPTVKNMESGLEKTYEKVYNTGRIAAEIAVHPNTVRFYERIGLISPALRSANGYRKFTYRHLIQLRICRVILTCPYTNSTLRKSALSTVEALKDWDVKKAKQVIETHIRLIEKEYSAALETAAMLKLWTEKKPLPAASASAFYNRREAAELLGVTKEVLRNWERNGLIGAHKKEDSDRRVYGEYEIARLRVIYMLRQNHYSIAAIQRCMSVYDGGNSPGAVLALNRPDNDPENEFLSAGDHWLEVLSELSVSAEKIKQILISIR
jgi:DNA-binding transcriptional MerR regulator/DNA-binding Xre family transcriptional regulator